MGVIYPNRLTLSCALEELFITSIIVYYSPLFILLYLPLYGCEPILLKSKLDNKAPSKGNNELVEAWVSSGRFVTF
jgi:hypothetical protein